MENDTTTIQCIMCKAGTLHIALTNLDAILDCGEIFSGSLREVVYDHDMGADGYQLVDKVRTDQAGTSGHSSCYST
ncbi:hypothetical protein RHDC4_03014 [Rhodocyclaceae bacterium]|nr:hypothetical protein RHDC4_03014 [Rhodocyclaceae bacterium]